MNRGTFPCQPAIIAIHKVFRKMLGSCNVELDVSVCVQVIVAVKN